MKPFIYVFLSLIIVSSFFENAFNVKAHASSETGNYFVGTGIYDITGPPAELAMMGYANTEQLTEGIHFRLRSRAFVIADSSMDQRVAIVSADLGMIFHSVTQGVVNKLKQKGYGDLYSYDNILLSATHTHSGPGGYSHEGLYNITTFGFYEENYDVIVDGIVQSIIQAHDNLEPGYLELNQGTVEGTSKNRSIEAYNNNPQSEKDQYEDSFDKTMTLLNFRNDDGQLLGVLNWFPVHPVSMGQENSLISGDNKGYASYLFEEDYSTDYDSSQTFVAAFAQSNEGDVTPNIFGDGIGYGENDFEHTKKAGEIQYEAAENLSEQATKRLDGALSSIHIFRDFSNLEINGEYTNGIVQSTFPSTLGYSFAAGTEDGRPETSILPSFYEGMTQPEYSINDHDHFYDEVQTLLSIVPQIGEMSGNQYPDLWEQHFPKPVLFAPSKVTPDAWTPQTIPIQMIQLGDLYLLSVPGEFTTMAGRRLTTHIKEQIDEKTGKDNTVIISGLSNSYSSYVATPEEYDKQHYEGASTQFGKWTLSAYLQAFTSLTDALINDGSVQSDPTPKDLSDEQVYLKPKVLFDGTPIGKEFGSKRSDVDSQYEPEETVKVSFWAGHPNNDFKTQKTYLEVQKKEGDQWVVIADDNDWNTKFYWKRHSTILATSFTTIKWNIPKDVEEGQYRIVHYGAHKNISGKISSYKGVSSTFQVNVN
ncbi:neutral/alkaline ceramidase [Bacillus carboniphilus]|uniref:Neutral ceramidase n=1 Tax=Bacillus carboniphilus TaxID=86663 RepID=A0ABY9JUC0_9BACI|nr:neutral/alkaline ceramidase [Bacillus carboniphilus]WLR43001.1 neutral/alkaline ceramidase [Bacillus carboniphilus]